MAEQKKTKESASAGEIAADATEESVAKVLKFSELSYKTEVVIRNTNKAEAVVTKVYWESVRKNGLGRLQGIELLGVAVRTAGGKGYTISPVEDDFEV